MGRALPLLALLATAAHAGPDFELFGLEGERVRLSELPPRVTVVNFWQRECPPCRRELPLLTHFAAERGEVRVITVALQSRRETEQERDLLPGPAMHLVAPLGAESLLRRFGNRSGALPYTVVLDEGGTPCQRQMGEITRPWLEHAALRCTPQPSASASAPTGLNP